MPNGNDAGFFTGGKWGKFAGREDYLEDYLTTMWIMSLRDSPPKQIRTIRRELHQITVEDREIYTGAKTILNICLDMMSPARVPTDVYASTSQLQTSSMTVTSHVLHWNNKQCSGDRLYWGLGGRGGFHLLQSNKQPIQNVRDQSRQFF